MIIKVFAAEPPKKETPVFPCIMQETGSPRYAWFLDRNKAIWLSGEGIAGQNVGMCAVDSDFERFEHWKRMDAGFTISLIQE